MSITDSIETAVPDRTPKRHRHAVKLRCLDVARVEQLSRSMVRIVLTGPELEGFASFGFDDHVKMFFPLPRPNRAEPAGDRPERP